MNSRDQTTPHATDAARTWPGAALRSPPHRRPLTLLWREWCFARSVLVRFGPRFALLAFVLIAGGTLFLIFEPDQQHTPARAIYFTWSLIFGQPPEAFPRAWPLQALYFIIPILGLTILIEAIVDFSQMMRDRRRHERSWCRTMAHSLSGHIILVGLGKLGYRTFLLLRQLGESVVVIERDPQNQFLEDVRRDGSALLIGDARRESLLADANVAGARSIVLASDDDLANLEIALDARRIRPDIRVVVRMFDQNMADKIRAGFNLPNAMSQAAVAAPAFAAAAIDRANVGSMVVGGRVVVMQRWTVDRDSPLRSQTVGDATTRYGVGVVEHRPRGGAGTLFPPPVTRIEEGDELLVQGALEALSRLRMAAR